MRNACNVSLVGLEGLVDLVVMLGCGWFDGLVGLVGLVGLIDLVVWLVWVSSWFVGSGLGKTFRIICVLISALRLQTLCLFSMRCLVYFA